MTRAECFGCGLPIVRGASLSGDLDPDGVVHYCRGVPWWIVRGSRTTQLYRRPNMIESTATLELEACGPAPYGQAGAYGVTCTDLGPNPVPHGFPIYRYSGTLEALARWLHVAYDDGSGETGAELLVRLLELDEGVPA